MRAKDAPRLSALRLIKTELLKFESDTGKAPNEEGIQVILKKMAKQRGFPSRPSRRAPAWSLPRRRPPSSRSSSPSSGGDPRRADGRDH